MCARVGRGLVPRLPSTVAPQVLPSVRRSSRQRFNLRHVSLQAIHFPAAASAGGAVFVSLLGHQQPGAVGRASRIMEPLCVARSHNWEEVTGKWERGEGEREDAETKQCSRNR
mmetsp:Transcript_1820/g.2649  ORF Transcript_1820/g.2649 Transcript_1820/m.2649 type:complete len:113 (+) Transcript_1820:1538-1876(+)